MEKRVRRTSLLILILFVFSSFCTATIKYTGYGANRTVSGSMHVIEIGQAKIMLDAGSFFGTDGKEEGRYDRELVDSICCILISHAHSDHVGNLAKIVNMGYRGPIYCTEPTAELLPVMLAMASRYGNFGTEVFYYSRPNRERYKDTAVHIYDSCQYGSRIRDYNLEAAITRRDRLAAENFYLCQECINMEVDKIMEKVKAIPPNKIFEPVAGIAAEFYLTPHLPGSVMIKLTDPSGKTLLYTGDVGSGLSPFLPQQQYPTDIDYLIVEATYGLRVESRETREDFQKQIGEYLRQGKRVIIPAFSLDRTQQVLFELTQGKTAKFIPPQTPITVIGSSVVRINRIYKEIFTTDRFSQYFSETFCSRGPFGPIFTEKSTIGKAEINHGEIAIVPSGMASASYAKEFVERWHADPDTVFVFVGYQDPATIGGQLIATGTFTILGVTREAKAEIKKFNCFSGHANFSQISELITRLGEVREVLLVHLNHYESEEVQRAYEMKFPKTKFYVPKFKEEYYFGAEDGLLVENNKSGRNCD